MGFEYSLIVDRLSVNWCLCWVRTLMLLILRELFRWTYLKSRNDLLDSSSRMIGSRKNLLRLQLLSLNQNRWGYWVSLQQENKKNPQIRKMIPKWLVSIVLKVLLACGWWFRRSSWKNISVFGFSVSNPIVLFSLLLFLMFQEQVSRELNLD